MHDINDFGEKIGGAKKDLWRKRRFSIEDLNVLTDSEASKFCIKNTIWPKPDYKELVQTKPVIVVYFIKKLRDSLPAKIKPTNNEDINKANRAKYVEFVSQVRDVLMNFSNESDLKDCFNKIFIMNGYYEKLAYSERWTDKAYNNAAITNKFIKASQISTFKIKNALEYINKTGFPSTGNTWKQNIKIRKLEDGFYITKYHGYYFSKLLDFHFQTYEEAEEYLNGPLRDELKNRKRKTISISLNKPTLTKIVRQCPNYRHYNVTTKMMLDTFKFRGGEFGNWANDEERQMHINYAYDALMDLASILNVSPEFISLGNCLGIAFGARGSGNALAHYEPVKVVINLTKIRGAGSLGHEWWHAFDHYISSLCGNTIAVPYISESLQRKKLISEHLSEKTAEKFDILLKSITEKEVPVEKVAEQSSKKFANSVKYLKSWTDPIIEELKTEQKTTKKNRRAATETEIMKFNKLLDDMYNAKLSSVDEMIDNFNRLYKSIKGCGINKSYRKEIYSNLHYIIFYKKQMDAPEAFHQKTQSNYLKEATKIDKLRKKPYWSTERELTARAFEAYIQDRLTQNNFKSDYLVHHAINCFGELKPYPEDGERIVINKAFDEFFIELNKSMNVEEFNIPEVIQNSSNMFCEKSNNIIIHAKNQMQMKFNI